ncbi:MAG: hypothetical protein U9N39_00380 [Campylobacterota bacterium]|nr:hypothetical protein [Campylobacterota bacterium]
MSAVKPLNVYCENRIKPTLLRDIKTEAILVFTRTALERYFRAVDETGIELRLGSQEETTFVYSTLKKLLVELQKYVVNVDYLIDITQNAARYPLLKTIAKKEESLMKYYDVMAQQVRNHFNNQSAYLPEFLVVCVLEEWILGEEKSTHLYAFLNDIDLLGLMGVFETNRATYDKDELCKVSDILELSSKVVTKLKEYKYKTNNTRVSKTRKKKNR